MHLNDTIAYIREFCADIYVKAPFNGSYIIGNSRFEFSTVSAARSYVRRGRMKHGVGRAPRRFGTLLSIASRSLLARIIRLAQADVA
jgi:hypothetical protein